MKYALFIKEQVKKLGLSGLLVLVEECMKDKRVSNGDRPIEQCVLELNFSGPVKYVGWGVMDIMKCVYVATTKCRRIANRLQCDLNCDELNSNNELIVREEIIVEPTNVPRKVLRRVFEFRSVPTTFGDSVGVWAWRVRHIYTAFDPHTNGWMWKPVGSAELSVLIAIVAKAKLADSRKCIDRVIDLDGEVAFCMDLGDAFTELSLMTGEAISDTTMCRDYLLGVWGKVLFPLGFAYRLAPHKLGELMDEVNEVLSD